AHPDYRQILWDYLKIASKGQTPHCIQAALAMHAALNQTGDMKNVDWGKYK
ncbi:Propionyl-CoA:succinate CoA transferase, partial [termite gut metagenome]